LSTSAGCLSGDNDTYLTTGQHPILLPPRLGALMRTLVTQPATRLMIHHRPQGPRWLFPGRFSGQPIDNHSLTNRLNRHGISAPRARNGALAALAAGLPAAILADLLGMHIHTAVRWVTYARRDWTDYLAARAAERDRPTGDELPIGGMRGHCSDQSGARVTARSWLFCGVCRAVRGVRPARGRPPPR
jgi:hypothetical protein